MGRRYRHTGLLKERNKAKRMAMSVWPDIPRLPGDLYIVANRGDRLDLLAKRYYNDPSDWWIIAAANGLGKGTLMPALNKQLRIPSDKDYVYKLLEDKQKNR